MNSQQPSTAIGGATLQHTSLGPMEAVVPIIFSQVLTVIFIVGTSYMGDGWHMDFKQTHFDSYSSPDFYARVGIAGAPADEIMKKMKAIEDNWTSVWDEEFTFPLTVPELALLRIEVHEYDLSEKNDFD
ncbi:Phosphoinositide-specific phospholipase C family protein [Perilla frutescens var. hirtella]|nr:Phosphoinositide-specific phospholipase C family protein [Perilla frutescens var. hirtella]